MLKFHSSWHKILKRSDGAMKKFELMDFSNILQSLTNGEKGRNMQADQKKSKVFFPAMLVANMAATMFIAFCLFAPAGGQSNAGSLAFDSDVQYVLYIGINDKDAYKQIIPTERAKEIVNGICAKYVKGYTGNDAQGGWFDENGVLVQENTLVYAFTSASESEIVAIMDEALAALNQNSILVERRDVSKAFYDGK
jgi:hypothetical protein